MMKNIFTYLFAVIMTLGFVACSSDDLSENTGYLKLDVETLVSTINRASVPAGYNAKTLSVSIVNQAGKTVLETNDVANDAKFKGNIELPADTYTITAHSAKWDGSDSGFNAPYYFGSTTAKVSVRTLTQASVTLTQANVKVTVKYDDNFRTYFNSASTTVSSQLSGVQPQLFTMGQTSGSAYFPVGGLNFTLNVINKKGQSFGQQDIVNGVKARDHYIVTYKVAEAGTLGGVHVYVDDATKTYNYTIEVPRKSAITLQASNANAFTRQAILKGSVLAKTDGFDMNSLHLQWKSATEQEWSNIPASQLTDLGEDNYTYTLTGLNPSTKYVYRLNYSKDDTVVNSNEIEFTTEEETPIYNSGFEMWYQNSSNKAWYPVENNTVSYWNSSNPGSSSIGNNNVTTSTETFVHGGNKAAKLTCKYIVIKFAAASLFTGDFQGLIDTSGAMLDWGVPFTSRPSALKGYFSYAPGDINRGNKPGVDTAPAKGSPDEFQIYCALLTEQLHVGGNATDSKVINGTKIVYEKSTAINWNTDPRVIAFGEMTTNEDSNGQWKEFNIPLEYHTLDVKPTHMLIVVSASKWGDYFYGSDSTVLYLDDFSFEYGTPTLKN